MTTTDVGPLLGADADGRIGCGQCGQDVELHGATVYRTFGRYVVACEFCADVLSGRRSERLVERILDRDGQSAPLSIEQFNALTEGSGF